MVERPKRWWSYRRGKRRLALWVPQTRSVHHVVSILSAHIYFLFTHPSTLFWAGDVFAPKLRVKNKHDQEVPIQQFLQNAFLDMWEMVVRAVGDLDGVIGFQVFHYIYQHHAPLK